MRWPLVQGFGLIASSSSYSVNFYTLYFYMSTHLDIGFLHGTGGSKLQYSNGAIAKKINLFLLYNSVSIYNITRGIIITISPGVLLKYYKRCDYDII